MEDRYIKIIQNIADNAGFEAERTANIISKISDCPEILEELIYYLDKNDFLCKTNISGYTLVDILIWQIDHFRAHLDRDTTLTRNNPQAMALMAIETMLKMKESPEEVISAYTKETGTDQIIS